MWQSSAEATLGLKPPPRLLAYCKSVTLLHRSESFRADEVTVEKVLKNPKMRAVKNTEILEVKGDKFVEGIVYKDRTTGKETELKVSGIFVEIGQIPNTGFAKDILELDKIGRVKIDPTTQKTGTPGIWAAGDCTDVLYHQNNIAAGDAVRALEKYLSSFAYEIKLKNFSEEMWESGLIQRFRKPPYRKVS